MFKVLIVCVHLLCHLISFLWGVLVHLVYATATDIYDMKKHPKHLLGLSFSACFYCICPFTQESTQQPNLQYLTVPITQPNWGVAGTVLIGAAHGTTGRKEMSHDECALPSLPLPLPLPTHTPLLRLENDHRASLSRLTGLMCFDIYLRVR